MNQTIEQPKSYELALAEARKNIARAQALLAEVKDQQRRFNMKPSSLGIKEIQALLKDMAEESPAVQDADIANAA